MQIDIDQLTASVIAKIQERYILVEKSAQPLTQEQQGQIVMKIAWIVCDYFHIDPNTVIETKTRRRFNTKYSYVTARWIVYLIARKHFIKKISFAAIGKHFGVDHATVINGINKMSNALEMKQEPYYSDFNKIEARFQDYVKHVNGV